MNARAATAIIYSQPGHMPPSATTHQLHQLYHPSPTAALAAVYASEAYTAQAQAWSALPLTRTITPAGTQEPGTHFLEQPVTLGGGQEGGDLGTGTGTAAGVGVGVKAETETEATAAPAPPKTNTSTSKLYQQILPFLPIKINADMSAFSFGDNTYCLGDWVTITHVWMEEQISRLTPGAYIYIYIYIIRYILRILCIERGREGAREGKIQFIIYNL